MQSDSTWIKNLARARYQNGQWIPADETLSGDGPFGALIEDVVTAVDTYNHHAAAPIRMLSGVPQKSPLLLTLLHGTAQIKFVRNGQFMDISLIKTRNFQSTEHPLARLTPIIDMFGHPTWMRGSAEWSADQLIKHVFIHLLEASQSA
jgi:hypothetical protein